MQPTLPFAASGRPHELRAHGTQIDFEAGTLCPVHFISVGNLLGRVLRHGVARSLRWERACSVLFHSVLVGSIASELARGGHLSSMPIHLLGPSGPCRWTDVSVQRLLGLYGALHNVGQLWGGDCLAQLPDDVRAPLEAYQARCSARLMLDLGLPLPSDRIGMVLRVAELLAVPVEAELCGSTGVPSVDWCDAAESLRVVGVDPPSFGLSVMRSLGVESRFPPHHRALSMWKALVRADLILLSCDQCVAGVVTREEFPKLPSGANRVSALLAWLRSFDISFHEFHDLGALRQRGKVEPWSIPVKQPLEGAA